MNMPVRTRAEEKSVDLRTELSNVGVSLGNLFEPTCVGASSTDRRNSLPVPRWVMLRAQASQTLAT
jgi:hypothetical protein